MCLPLKVTLHISLTRLARKQAEHRAALVLSRLLSAFARETARENVFTVHLIADCFHFSGSSLKPELGS